MSDIRSGGKVRPIKIAALDPGKMTGLCVGTFQALKYNRAVLKEGTGAMWFEFCEEKLYELYTDDMEQAYRLTKRLLDIDVLVVERFIPYEGGSRGRQSQKDYMWPQQLIGGLIFWAVSEGVPVELQSAADAKTIINDARLKAWGKYQRGQRHARDAQRHFLLYVHRHLSELT